MIYVIIVSLTLTKTYTLVVHRSGREERVLPGVLHDGQTGWGRVPRRLYAYVSAAWLSSALAVPGRTARQPNQPAIHSVDGTRAGVQTHRTRRS